ncbi:alpha/beta hydrolase [Legionella sp. CNM-4043-24]|uniref:alpha/beta hydrolase n=1 Tax=Legionella sp. CNM-4043-24 TaxID=3421646 RepID=UPI00403ADBE9
MNLDDFRCMRRGQHLSTVSPDNATLLKGINWRNGKKNRALLMLHGFGSTPAVFRYMTPHIQGYDAIVVPPLPGHAVSLDAFAHMKADDLKRFVEQTCSELCQEYDQVDVLGLSLGGVLACHLSQLFPLHHLYLLSPAIDIHLAINKTIALAQGLQRLGFRYIRSIGGNLYTSAYCEISLRLLPLSTIVELLTMLRQFQFAAPVCPTDVFLGCHDEVVSSHCVAARFANQAQVNIHWLKNSAHVLPLDGDVDAILQCMRENNAVTAVPLPA